MGRRRRQRRSATARSDGLPRSVNAAAVHGLQTKGVLAMGAQSNRYTEITAANQGLIVRGCFLGRNKGTGTYC